jgi:hypothetical protein
MLPMHFPAAALAELARARTLPGVRGVYMATSIAGRELSDTTFFPVYEAIEAAGLPVFLHPNGVIGHERLTPHYLHNLLGNPFETAIAAAHLIFGGVLDRFPRLRCLPHAVARSVPRRTARAASRSGQNVAGHPLSTGAYYDRSAITRRSIISSSSSARPRDDGRDYS